LDLQFLNISQTEERMKNKLGIISLVLWALTISIFAIFFVKGTTTVSSDQRRAIMLSPSEKDLVLGEMRTMLTAVNGVLGALSESDMKKAATSCIFSGNGYGCRHKSHSNGKAAL
jgi:hypothetical protein